MMPTLRMLGVAVVALSAAATLFSFAAAASSVPVPQASVAAPVAEIGDDKTLVALASETWAPPLVIRDGGVIGGFVPELFGIIADEAGLSLRFEFLPRLRMDQGILSLGDARCYLSPQWVAPQFRDAMTWSLQLFSVADMLLVSTRQAPSAFPGVDALTGVVATVLGYKYPAFDGAFASGRLVREDVNSEEQVIRKVAAGRNAFGVANVLSAAYAVSKDPGLRGKFKLAAVVEATPIHCAVRKDGPRAAAILAAAERAKLNGRIDALVRRYTSVEAADLGGGR